VGKRGFGGTYVDDLDGAGETLRDGIVDLWEVVEEARLVDEQAEEGGVNADVLDGLG
jgi:hypothetical protein